MNNGFVIIATTYVEYQAACIAAMSIILHNKDANVSLVVPDKSKVPKKFILPFDNIIDLPFGEYSSCREHDWQLYWATPYDSTIVVDCYTINMTNYDILWDTLTADYDVCFCDSVTDFQGNQINTASVYTEYDLPKLNTAIWFFKSDNKKTLEYFKLLDPLSKDWYIGLSNLIDHKYVPKEYDSDLMHSICCNLTWDGDYFVNGLLEYIVISVDNNVDVWISSKGDIKIGNYNMCSNLFYNGLLFNLDELYSIFSEVYNEFTRKQ